MDEPGEAEKLILRNQRYMMLALSTLLQNNGGMMTGFHAVKLTDRVKEMERAFNWIASPSERL